MRYILTLILTIVLLTPAHADCPPPTNMVHLFIRLVEPSMHRELTDTEIVGAVWQDIKQLKHAAHEDRLLEYASGTGNDWALKYGTADDLWAVLNCSDRKMRQVLRDMLPEWRKRNSDNTRGFLEARARKHFGRGKESCGCAY